MRVIQAHSRHATVGGADHVLERERRLLEAAGHEVRQLLAAPGDEQSGPVWRRASDVVWNPTTYATATRMMRDWQPDLLHVHTPFPVLSPSVFRAAHRLGVPTVGTVHSYRYSCIKGTLLRDGAICEVCVGSALKLAGVRHRCYHDSTSASLAMTTGLIAHRALGTFSDAVGRFLPLTDFSADVLVRDGIPRGRILVKPNCVDDPGTPLPYEERDDVVVFAGRLVGEKGVATLLEGWRSAERDGCRLVIAGEGPLRAMVEKAASDDPGVELCGWLDQDALRSLQARARATLVTSEWYEAGPPLVLLESLALGTPVIAPDLGNISSTVLAGGAGRTFRTGDADDLARTLSQFLVDPAASRAAAAARTLYLRDHTPAVTLTLLERAYREATEVVKS